tara:strand:+ start:88 stop:531 length:444 start_codon:yes stop_codon:yes gene_type:complete
MTKDITISKRRHVAKTITWRIVGTLDTMFLAWIITGDPVAGFKIGALELVTKFILYYIHERVWSNIRLKKSKTQILKIDQNKKRHIIKTFSWRAIGTLDTMFLAWIITGNPLTGLKISLFELITKMFLYYFHERIWFMSNYGIVKKL